MRKTLAWGLPLLAIPILGLLAYGLTRPDRYVLPSALIGLPAPQFRLADLQDPADTLSLERFGGRVVVLNFWASWCGPCVAEHPFLSDLVEVYDPDDVQLLGILYQDTPERGRAFIERYGGGWPTVIDPESRTAIPYGVYGPPETFIVSPEGAIAYKLVGPVVESTYPAVRATIDSLLASRDTLPLETRR